MTELSAIDIKENIAKIKTEVAEFADKYARNINDVQIMAVTKRTEPKFINIAVSHGIKLIGENRAQELVSKYDALVLKKESIHFIGYLQINKIKSIIDKVSMIHSADSIKFINALDNQMKKRESVMDCLVQINIGNEPTKSGILQEETEEFLKNASKFENVNIKGLMAIPPPSNSDLYFGRMQKLFVDIKDKNIDNINMEILSMGMSNDYLEAVKYGSNIIRIGTKIFGTRL